MKLKPIFRIAFIFLLALSLLLSAFAQESSISLREGVVIDKSRKTIYTLSPDKKLQAVSLTSGEVLWTSADSIKPLTLVNGRLLAQAISSQNDLVIKQLDITQRGKQLNRNSILLPANIKADFRPSLSYAFKTYTRVINGTTYILWEYTKAPLRGMPDEDSARKDADPIRQSGIVRVEGATGRLISVQKSALTQSQINKRIKMNRGEGIANNADQQFLSTDENHIVTSKRVVGDEEFFNYLWEIFVRSSGTKVGELRDYRSFTPFYVTGTTLIYDVGPYTRVVNGAAQEVPLQLVAVNLSNGRELWRRPIFDPVIRLAPPPGIQ